VPGTKRALFVDWGGTLALTKDNRTVVDAAGHPVLMPNVAATLARERPRFDVCFIVSNQARISRGEISADEVLRRFAWVDARLGRPFTDWRLCPHGDEDGCGCRKPRPGMFLELAGLHDVDLPGPPMSAIRSATATRRRAPASGFSSGRATSSAGLVEASTSSQTAAD